MANPFIGEIRMFGGNFAPAGWMQCDGQLLPISGDYEPLFNLIGTTYGGDGQTTFGLPDLQSRVPVHQGSNGESTYTIGETAGAEAVTVLNPQLPSHSHGLPSSDGSATQASPVGGIPAAWTSDQYSDVATGLGAMGAAVLNAGGNQPHDNMLPYLGVTFIISLFGVYPTQS
jgi:microcystin-dependent protein